MTTSSLSIPVEVSASPASKKDKAASSFSPSVPFNTEDTPVSSEATGRASSRRCKGGNCMPSECPYCTLLPPSRDPAWITIVFRGHTPQIFSSPWWAANCPIRCGKCLPVWKVLGVFRYSRISPDASSRTGAQAVTVFSTSLDIRQVPCPPSTPPSGLRLKSAPRKEKRTRGSEESRERARMGSRRPVSQEWTERVTTRPPLLRMTSVSTTGEGGRGGRGERNRGEGRKKGEEEGR